MKIARLMLAPVLVLLVCVATAAAVQPTNESLDAIEKNLAEQKAIMVDVREDTETNEGYVAGAVLVPLSHLKEGRETPQFTTVLAQILGKDKVIYTYCASGERSLEAAAIFTSLGYDTRSMKHGFQDLVDEGFVVAKPKAE